MCNGAKRCGQRSRCVPQLCGAPFRSRVLLVQGDNVIEELQHAKNAHGKVMQHFEGSKLHTLWQQQVSRRQKEKSLADPKPKGLFSKTKTCNAQEELEAEQHVDEAGLVEPLQTIMRPFLCWVRCWPDGTPLKPLRVDRIVPDAMLSPTSTLHSDRNAAPHISRESWSRSRSHNQFSVLGHPAVFGGSTHGCDVCPGAHARMVFSRIACRFCQQRGAPSSSITMVRSSSAENSHPGHGQEVGPTCTMSVRCARRSEDKSAVRLVQPQPGSSKNGSLQTC